MLFRSLVGQWLYRATGYSLPFTTAGAMLAEAFVAMPFLVLTVEAGLRSALGTKVRLARSRRGGRIVIDFYSDEDLARLYERLVGSA